MKGIFKSGLIFLILAAVFFVLAGLSFIFLKPAAADAGDTASVREVSEVETTASAEPGTEQQAETEPTASEAPETEPAFGTGTALPDTEETALETVVSEPAHVNVTFARQVDGSVEYGVITGTDDDGATVWSITTGRYEVAQVHWVEEVCLWNDLYCYKEEHCIIALNPQDGTEVWVADCPGGGVHSCTTEDMLYVTTYIGCDFMAIDKNGNVVQQIDSLNSDYYRPCDIALQDRMLAITYEDTAAGGSGTLYVNPNDWTYGETGTPADGSTAQSTGSFTDVADDAFYKEPVLWAVEQGITKGASGTTFEPDTECTRGQAITFLWRLAGKPEASAENPFTDVSDDSPYLKAILWAYENGIAFGTSEDVFSPDETVTRGQFVTYLWRYAGKPEAEGEGFDDVTAESSYYSAVQWAVSQGITSGTGDGMFSPDAHCTRAQVVTFLYRYANAG